MKNHLLMKAIIGSRAYNLNIESSDTDYRGVYLESDHQIFGLEKAEPSHFPSSKDDTIYSLKQFVNLLAKGNPNILELVWLQPEFYEILDPIFEMFFIDCRKMFLSKSVGKSYLGYAKSQIHLVEKNSRAEHSRNGYDAKAAMHVFRLLYQLKHLLLHKNPQVFVNHETRKFLLRVRDGSMFRSIDDFKEEANAWFNEIDSLLEDSYLVDKVDHEWLNDHLVDFYRRMK
jgi:uncharacterized protein